MLYFTNNCLKFVWFKNLSNIRNLILTENYLFLSWFKILVNISNSRERDSVHEEYEQKLREQEAFHREQIQRQQLFVEDLKQQILSGQIKAERELENDQALINHQIRESKRQFLSHFSSVTAYFHHWLHFTFCIFVYLWWKLYCCLLVSSYSSLSLKNSYQTLANIGLNRYFYCMLRAAPFDQLWSSLLCDAKYYLHHGTEPV